MKGAGIGLLVLLLGVAIIFWIMFGGKDQGGGYVQQELDTREKATEQVNGFSGKDADGEIVTKTINFEAGPKGVVVHAVEPGSPFDKKYGLKPNDVILEIGPLETKEQATDDKSADAYLRDAYARNQPLVVLRGTQRLTLPDQRDLGAAAAPETAAGGVPPAPSAPIAPEPPKRQSPTGAARDLVNQIQTH